MLNLYFSEIDYDGMTPKEREIYEDLLEYRKEKEKKENGCEPVEDRDRPDDTICEAVVWDMLDVVNSIYLN